MVSSIQGVNEEEQPEPHHGEEVAEDGTARGRGNHVIGDGERKGRHVQADSVVNPETTEGCASRTGNQFGHKVPDRVGKHREDDAADDVPRADIEVREPGPEERQDELEDHQNEGEDDESVHHERKLGPFKWLAEAGGDEYPAGEHNRTIPDPEQEPS